MLTYIRSGSGRKAEVIVRLLQFWRRTPKTYVNRRGYINRQAGLDNIHSGAADAAS